MNQFRIAVLLLMSPILALAADLSGTWHGNDGGTYYLVQRGNSLNWYGEQSSTNPAWSNVFNGRIHGDRIRGNWTDVPKGRTRGHGKLELRITSSGNTLDITRKSGGFGGSTLTRESATAPPPTVQNPAMKRPAMPAQPAQPPMAQARPHRIERMVKEDCVSFNWRNTQRKQVNGNWKLVDGNHWLFDFGNKDQEAAQALRIIKHYRLTNSCFVGRPAPSFKYMLSNGNAPSGALRGEDCIGFNPASISVEQHGGSWKIVDGSHWLFDFGSKQAEAQQSLAIIKKHRFNESCYVGRPDPSFTYMRR